MNLEETTLVKKEINVNNILAYYNDDAFKNDETGLDDSYKKSFYEIILAFLNDLEKNCEKAFQDSIDLDVDEIKEARPKQTMDRSPVKREKTTTCSLIGFFRQFRTRKERATIEILTLPSPPSQLALQMESILGEKKKIIQSVRTDIQSRLNQLHSKSNGIRVRRN